LVESVFYQQGTAPLRQACTLSRPARAAAYLRGLLQPGLERLRLQAPLEGIGVCAPHVEPLRETQTDLFADGSANHTAALAALLDSLAVRLGQDAVTVPRLIADPQPELACRFESALSASTAPERVDVPGPRPVCLYPRPIPIEVTALVP